MCFVMAYFIVSHKNEQVAGISFKLMLKQKELQLKVTEKWCSILY
jgi:hypothetical protein